MANDSFILLVHNQPADSKQVIGKSSGGLNAKVHLIATRQRKAGEFSIVGWQVHHAPQNRALPENRA